MTRSTMSPDRPAHARRSDPLSSHLTLASLGRDDSLKARVLAAAFRLEERSGGRPWNDTQLTEEIERHTRTRQQRNIIARTRDLMTAEWVTTTDADGVVTGAHWTQGWFRPTGLDQYEGRELSHYVTSPEARTAP